MVEYRFDTQLLIKGENLSEDKINEYITKNIEGDCLLAVGDVVSYCYPKKFNTKLEYRTT